MPPAVRIPPVNSSQNIFLVGMMGAGKTTIGRQLARRLGRRFVDCDHEIEERCGVKIPIIFDIEGDAKKALTVEKLIEKFHELRHKSFENDRTLLSND